MQNHIFGIATGSGKPLLYIADALGIATILAGWLGLLPVVFTAFATFWASMYYLAMFYQSDMCRDLCARITSIRRKLF